MTGHGNVVFTEEEAHNLREYLLGGGFLHADDNYGLVQAFRREMKKVFPEDELVEIPWEHPIFNQKYTFSEGLPKIHEHDAKRPQALGVIKEGRLVVYLLSRPTWEMAGKILRCHNDHENKRQEALQMGANIISYVFSNLRYVKVMVILRVPSVNFSGIRRASFS